MISFQDAYTKFQAISGSSNATDLTQAKQDINIGYKRFNAAISRYFTRKQLFTNLVAGQKYYQTPVDAIRVSSVSYLQSGSTLEYPLTQIRDEDEWRQINVVPQTSNYISFFFVYGNDQIGLYPTPSTTVTNGLRYVYQPQDVDLTKDDYTTGTIAITNGGVTVTGTGTAWAQAAHGNMQLQVTDGSDGNWYDILSVNSTTSITLRTPYAGASVSGVAYRLGQMFIFPGEYDDVPVDYALYRFWQSRNNDQNSRRFKTDYETAVKDAVAEYSSSSTSNVIMGPETGYNPWTITPLASS